MSLWEQYLRPRSLADALSALWDSEGPATIIAGGTDLLLDLDQGRHHLVETLVDVTAVPEMTKIHQTDGWIHVGAAAPLRDVIEHPLMESNAEALVEASELIGGPQVRNVATLGGNVAHALPAGDGTIVLLALGAEAQVATPGDTAWKQLDELFAGPGKPTFDRSKDILVQFRFPVLQPREGSAFRRIMRPQGVAIAILNMAARLQLDAGGIIQGARVAIGPAGPRPLRARATEGAIEGRSLDADMLERGLQELIHEVSLRTSPHRATAQYRKHLLGRLLKETLTAAHSRAASASIESEPVR